MAEVLQHLGRYSSLLDSYVEAPSKHLLAALAGLGRDLVLEDVHPEDIAELHENALADITQRSDGGSVSAAGRPAGLGLMEILKTFRDRTSALEGRQRELEQNEARLRNLLNSSPAVIYTASPEDLGVTFMSGNVRKILGYEPAQFERELSFWPRQIHPDDLDRVLFERSSIHDSEELCCTYRMRRCGGDYIWVRDSLAKATDGGARSPDLIGCLLEVTAQVESKRRGREFMDHMTESIITFDERGTIDYCNHATLKVFGYQTHELVREDIGLLDLEPSAMSLCRPLSGGDSSDRTELEEVIARHKDGSRVFLEATLSRVDLEDRPLIMANFRDVGERKLAEKERESLKEQLRHSNRVQAIGSLAGGIAHDFNNILVPILGLTEVTMNRLPEDSPERTNLRTIIAAAEQAKSLAQSLLAYSQHDEIELQPLQLQQVVPGALSLLRAALPAMIKIEQCIDETCGAIEGTEANIHQIILNLGINAAKAMDSNGTLKVSLEERDGVDAGPGGHTNDAAGRYAVLTVSDDGCGIQPALLEHIFEPFFSTRAPGEGSGIGLSVVSDIVKSYGGRISVSSRLGEGTEFRLAFPLSTENKVSR
ncbi:MAG: PAS domain S-box protein [Proteobacteria bacterium]|nr:PAS domain S-box protein [Pseudomonadota bacterium]